MNKKLLSVAVAAAAGFATSSAMAAVDLNASPIVPAYVASEATVASTGSTLTNAGGDLNVVVDSGFSISDGTARYMRFDFTGATFAAAMTSASLAVDDTSGVGAASEVLSTGGAAKGNFVVFEVTASTGKTVEVDDNATLTMPNLTITDQSGVAVTYKLFDSAVNAVNNTDGTALVTKTGTLASFVAAYSVSGPTTAPTAQKIDVTQDSKYFEGGSKDAVAPIGGFRTTNNATVTPEALDQTTAVTKPTVEKSSTLTVSGDFTYTQDLTNGSPDGTYTTTKVYLAQDVTCTTALAAPNVATKLTATEAVFTTTGIANTKDTYVCVTANGVSMIPEASYTASYAVTGNTGYSKGATALTLNTLEKNGATKTLNLALTPGGVFKNWIRINNTSNITGDVQMTIYNDAGKAVSIDLSDIEGISSSAMSGQSSTGLIDIAKIAAAGTAKDATWAVGAAPNNKLRLVITGEFSSIDAQSITTATDNTTFTTF